jgi:Protein of unknown function (DUF3102)
MPETSLTAPLSAPTLPPISSLSESDLARQINETIEAMERAFRNNVWRAIEVGDLLIEAKKRVGHGSFEAWLRDHCKLSFSTARRYIAFAKDRPKIEAALNGKSVTVTDLSLTAAKRLIEDASASSNSTTQSSEEQKSKSETKRHHELSQKQKLKQVDDFKKIWEGFEDWQRRKFLKPFKDRIAELLEELENEVEAA